MTTSTTPDEYRPAMKWGFLAGCLGALGALSLTFALTKAGGKPSYVMPIVFGGAVTVNAIVAYMNLHKDESVNPLMWVGMLLVALGICLTAGYTPHGHAPAAASDRRSRAGGGSRPRAAHSGLGRSSNGLMSEDPADPLQRVRAIDTEVAHVWMIRTFLKHADESEEDEDLRDIVRDLYDFILAVGPVDEVEDPAGLSEDGQEETGQAPASHRAVRGDPAGGQRSYELRDGCPVAADRRRPNHDIVKSD